MQHADPVAQAEIDRLREQLVDLVSMIAKVSEAYRLLPEELKAKIEEVRRA